MDTVVLVRSGLRQQLLTVNGLPDVQQWEGDRQSEGQAFPPPIGTPWLRETMLRQPGPSREVSVGAFGRIRHSGGWQISLFFPPDEVAGVRPLESLGEAIRRAFPHSLDLTFDGQLFRCLGCGLGTITTDEVDGWNHLPARITWTADTFNPI